MTDEINSPSHYMLFPDMEAIDVIKAALTPEEFAGYCKGNALKYRLRAGEKGPAEKCIAKACWYQNKLREVTRAEFGQQNTIDCRSAEQKGGAISVHVHHDQDVRLSDALDARTLSLAAKAFRP